MSDIDTAQAANAEVQAKADEAAAKGYYGDVPHDEHPDEAYSLKTGPDAPPLIADNQTRFQQAPTGPADTAPQPTTGDEQPLNTADTPTLDETLGENGDNQ